MERTEIQRAFARNLKYYLAREGKTQADMTKYMKVSSATTSDWCTGKKIPRADKLQSICNWLGISLGQLMTLDDPFESPPKPSKEAIELASKIVQDSRRRRIADMIVRLDAQTLETVELIVEKLSK